MRYGTIGFTLVAECPECGLGQLRVRTRRADGKPFLSCDRFPQCRCAMPYARGLEEIHGEMEALRFENRALRAHRGAIPMNGSEAASAVRDLLVRFHPDRRGATVATLEISQAVGEIYNRLKGGGR